MPFKSDWVIGRRVVQRTLDTLAEENSRDFPGRIIVSEELTEIEL
jgi:hypothetical protein